MSSSTKVLFIVTFTEALGLVQITSCRLISMARIVGNSKFFLMLFFGDSYYCLLIKKISSKVQGTVL